MKAILFDLDETLVDRDATMRRFLSGQHARFHDRLRSSAESYVAAVLSHQKCGYADKLLAYQASCQELGEASSLPAALLDDLRERYGFDAAPMPGALAAVAALRPHYALGIVTNGRARGQNAKIDSLGIRRSFKSIVVSETFGCKKPDPAIYQACLAELGAAPEEAIFIGDNPLLDVEAPRRLGLRSVWLRNARFDPPVAHDGIVDTLAEFAAQRGEPSLSIP